MTLSFHKDKLQAICRSWASAVAAIDGRDGRIGFFQAELPALLSAPELFEGLFRGIQKGDPYPDLRQETMFANELVLYRDPGRLFRCGFTSSARASTRRSMITPPGGSPDRPSDGSRSPATSARMTAPSPSGPDWSFPKHARFNPGKPKRPCRSMRASTARATRMTG
jgi:hypothetical protein